MKHTPILIAVAGLALVLPSFAQDPFAGGDANAEADPFAGKPAKRVRLVPNPNDPFGPKVPAPAPVTKEPPAEHRADVGIKYEVFSLDLATAAKLMRNDLSDVDLYKVIVAKVADKKAKQEGLAVMRTKSGMRSKVESSFEYIYPTEWDPAEIPSNVGIKIDPPRAADGKTITGPIDAAILDEALGVEDIPLFTTPANATAFETRNLGFTLEVDVVRNDGGIIEATVAPEHVTLANVIDWGQGVSTVQMPEIESQRITTSVLLVPGLPRLIGTMNRPPVSKVDPKSKEQIWFAFMTASNVK